MELKLEREERRARELKEKEEHERKEKREREEQERKDHICREELRLRELKEERKYEMEKLEKDRFNMMLMRFMCGNSTVGGLGGVDESLSEASTVHNKDIKVQQKGEDNDSQPLKAKYPLTTVENLTRLYAANVLEPLSVANLGI